MPVELLIEDQPENSKQDSLLQSYVHVAIHLLL